MINSVVLMGRLTYQPEIKVTPSGVSVLRLQIAVDRNYQKQGEERKTDFIDCVAWRNTAEFIGKKFKKGNMIAIEGNIQTESYTDKNGDKRKSVDVIVNQASFCGSKAESNGQQATPFNNPAPTYYENNDFEEIEDEDDLPF